MLARGHKDQGLVPSIEKMENKREEKIGGGEEKNLLLRINLFVPNVKLPWKFLCDRNLFHAQNLDECFLMMKFPSDHNVKEMHKT